MRIRTGAVASYDDSEGLGTIDDGGERIVFHATAISDGSRRVSTGAEVAFLLGPGPAGRMEAVVVAKLHEQEPRLQVRVRPLADSERATVWAELEGRWGGSFVVSRGERVGLAGLDALVAVTEDGERVGVLSWRETAGGLEVVTLDALVAGRGVGSALLEAAERLARSRGLGRLFLITTNDNLRALGFYLRRGLSLVAVHHNALSWSREVKPTIPERAGGIALSDEVELELVLSPEGR